jgi:hypothetical protein
MIRMATISGLVGGCVARSLVTLVLPHGYTLTVAGSLSVDVYHLGPISPARLLSFVGGALLAFLALAAMVRGHVREPTRAPGTGWRLANLVPLLSVSAAAAMAYLIPWPALAYMSSAFVAVCVYIVGVSVFVAAVGTATDTLQWTQDLHAHGSCHGPCHLRQPEDAGAGLLELGQEDASSVDTRTS